eukprot:11964781-Alexandrium_andersonii.AAC.1
MQRSLHAPGKALWDGALISDYAPSRIAWTAILLWGPMRCVMDGGLCANSTLRMIIYPALSASAP